MISNLIWILFTVLTERICPSYGRVLLYDTEDSVLEQFDCIYYVAYGERVSYCRRIGTGTFTIDWEYTSCLNDGTRWSFEELIGQNRKPGEILSWSSSLESADNYAGLYYNRSTKCDGCWLCQCKPGSFGIFCQYQLTHDAESFEQSINAQFRQKASDKWGIQQYGNIICYTTLICNYGILCLDWRDICDGYQQCMYGLDEENCDTLEFNECEENEYRCDNGMCVAEEYWLDGVLNPFNITGDNRYPIETDCMDWTDEKSGGYDGFWCPTNPRNIECDEHVTHIRRWSCGDGEFILWRDRMAFQNLIPTDNMCYNLRNLYYLCELARPQPLWTFDDGMCLNEIGYDDPSLDMHQQMSDTTRCVYVIQCALSNGFEHDCPCNYKNCSQVLNTVCDKRLIYRVVGGIVRPYIFGYYHWVDKQDWTNPMMDEFQLNGAIKCRGYEASSTENHFITHDMTNRMRWVDNILFCDENSFVKRNYTSSHRFHELCWSNESRTFSNRSYAFYDICTSGGRECISQYRIQNKIEDCSYFQDEESLSITKDLCWNLRKHRFRCSPEQPSCIGANLLGTGYALCNNLFDENLHGTGVKLSGIFCLFREDPNCPLLRKYTNESWMATLTKNVQVVTHSSGSSTRLQYLFYCDSNWQLPDHSDESSIFCKDWICLSNQYQCKTGQCISLEWVCDGEWDCSDASDEEALILNQPWSSHNEKLNLFLAERINNCTKRYSKQPFSSLCDINSLEFPCYPANISNPLDVLNGNHRPCIRLNQIGDGVSDCYMSLDERNILRSNHDEMLGFNLRCADNSYIEYLSTCLNDRWCFDPILCSYKSLNKTFCSGSKDVVCLNKTCATNARCNGIYDCFPHGEDEYWCASGTTRDLLEYYRFTKNRSPAPRYVTWFLFPAQHTTNVVSAVPKLHFETKGYEIFYKHSYTCNRGVAVMNHERIVFCFCPPTYFGRKCEYFSDRITIVTRLDRTTLPKILIDVVLIIQAILLFDGKVIDHHEFYSDSFFDDKIKQRFYLLYSRSNIMLQHKKSRYFNRSDILSDHPYTVHFDVYSQPNNESIPEELGSWHYPIYFDFLPAHRLAPILKFPSWFNGGGTRTLQPCQNITCSLNSNCKPLFMSNKNNADIVNYYCSCKSGFYGKNCKQYAPKCDSYCTLDSICKPMHRGLLANTLNPFCLCPFNRFGARCNLRYDECDRNPCFNNGTCHVTRDPSGERQFVCICSKFFYGYRCQQERASIRIDIANLTFNQSVAVLAQFYDVHNRSLELQFRHQQVYKGVPVAILYNHPESIAPTLGVLRIYDRLSETPLYFIMYIQYDIVKINVTSSPAHCPNVLTILPKDDSWSAFSFFKYHHLCRNNSELFCFYDPHYLCICQEDHYRVDCFHYATRPGLYHCDSCLSDGKCVKGSPDNQNDFVCLCPYCHQGKRCEFSLQAFSFTLDFLIIDDVITIQYVYIGFAGFLFVVGFFTNLCSFITFKRPKPRKFGVGNYLFIVSVLNTCSIFCLLIQLIHIGLGSLGLTNDVSCKTINYFLSVFTRSAYWLTTWITVDRLRTVLSPMNTMLKSPRIAIFFSIVTLVSLFGMHTHELILFKRIKQFDSSITHCVINSTPQILAIYNRISTISHYTIPFLVQSISITLLILLAARSRAKTSGYKATFRQVLSKQFRIQRELYVTPIIIILSALPQVILSVTLACTQLSNLQRHTLLIGYLFSYTPQFLGFILHVLPSTEYRKEFAETVLGKKLLRSRGV